MENRRAGSESFSGIEHRRQWLVLDANFFQRALRRAQIFGNDGGDQFAVKADFIDGDEVLIICELEMLMGRQLEPRVLAVEMLAIHDCQNARRSFRFD